MGLNAQVLALLKEFAQVNVSLDGLGESYYQSRGYRGDVAAIQTLKSLIHEKVRCGINLVLSKSTLQSLENTVETVVALGVREVQLLRYKPAAGADYQRLRLNAEEGLSLWPRIKALIQRFPGVIFRGDCALVPFLSVHPIDQSRLAPFMIRGCHGGDGLQAVDSQGGVHPCSFVQVPLSPTWQMGVRAAPCGDCAWQKVCRGGCHAVAQASGDLWAPDPECPRVLAHG
jgi:MoaA/NifB/PqqE/SkfB family radical SAM enzyme